MTQTTGEVVGLSPSDLPVSGKDTPQFWVVNEGTSSTEPPLGGTLQTSHPRPRAIRSPSSPPTLEASLEQTTLPLKVHPESLAGPDGATS